MLKSFHESVYVWAYRMNIVGLSYRGGALDGPNLNRLLENTPHVNHDGD